MKVNRRSRIKILVTVLTLFSTITWTNIASAYDLSKYDVQIVTTDSGDVTKLIVESLQNKFRISRVFTPSETHIPKKKNAIYVAVGPSAFRELLMQGPEGMIVSLFTSSQAYKTILESIPESKRTAVTAIYAEPSPFDQLRLIAALFKNRTKVAVLLSDKNEYLSPILRQAASLTPIDLTIEPISVEDNINRALNRVASLPVLLAVPDSAVYNAENIHTILLTAYRHNQAVVGFSAALVKAGALASTYSKIDDIIAQLEELLSEHDVSGRLFEPQFPKYFEVVVNDNVARSLNLVIDDSVKKLSRKPGGK